MIHFQATAKLLNFTCQISGEIFYITDDHPTNMEFIFKPLRKFLKDRKNDRNRSSNQIHCWHLANFGFQVPKAMAILYSTMFSYLSMVFGKSFQMPAWGLTYMELQKVCNKKNECENYCSFSYLNSNSNILHQICYIMCLTTSQITVSHYFSTQKAKNLLDYKPEIRLSDWKEIVDALKNKSLESNVPKFSPCIKLLFVFISGTIAVICHVLI